MGLGCVTVQITVGPCCLYFTVINLKLMPGLYPHEPPRTVTEQRRAHRCCPRTSEPPSHVRLHYEKLILLCLHGPLCCISSPNKHVSLRQKASVCDLDTCTRRALGLSSTFHVAKTLWLPHTHSLQPRLLSAVSVLTHKPREKGCVSKNFHLLASD